MKQPPPEVLQEWADRSRRRPLKAARDTTRTPARQFHSGNDRLPRLNLHPSDSCSTGRKHRYLPSIIHLRATAGRESQCYKHPLTVALLVSFNWPLPSIRGQMFVCNPPPGFVVPKRPKNTIFQSWGRVYGNPPISDLLPRQELTAEHLEGYSPESIRIMDKLGFYVDQPQESGYGPCIPIPLGVDKNSPFRHPNCKLGWGADPNSDEDNYQVYTSYSTSAPGETEESSEGADHREPSPEGVEGVQQTISQSDMELGELPLSLEDGGQPTVDELEEINLGTTDDPQPTFIAKALPDKEKAALKDLLGEFRDVFA